MSFFDLRQKNKKINFPMMENNSLVKNYKNNRGIFPKETPPASFESELWVKNTENNDFYRNREQASYPHESFNPIRKNQRESLKDLKFWHHDREEEEGASWLKFLSTPTEFLKIICLLFFLSTFLWLFYYWLTDGSNSAPVLIQAEQGPFKIKPGDPGGAVIPYQDRLIYGHIDSYHGGPREPIQETPTPPSAFSHPIQGHYVQPQPVHPPIVSHSSDPSYSSPHPHYYYPPSQDRRNESPSYYSQSSSQPTKDLPTQSYQPELSQSRAYSLPIVSNTSPSYGGESRESQKSVPLKINRERFSPKKGEFYVQVGIFSSKGLAQKEVNRLYKVYFNKLNVMNIFIQEILSGAEKKYRVLAGPIASKNEAFKRCGDLGVTCRVKAF